jgi:hypothetical protein
MNTLSVMVGQPSDAFMLAEWLKNIRFVHEVKIDIANSSTGNVKTIQEILDTIKSKQLFSEITDPVSYQRQIRDEWN